MPCVTLLPLSCQYISKDAIFILDVGWALLLYITVHSPKWFLNDVLGKDSLLVSISKLPQNKKIIQASNRLAN